MQPLRSVIALTSSPATTRHGTMGKLTTAPPAMHLYQRQPLRTRHIAALVSLGMLLTVLAAVTSRQLTDPRATPRMRRASDPLVRRLTIFGVDDRRAVSDPTLYPYSAVGLLKWSADRVCTASLIGTKYALTAADCVFARDGTLRPSTLAKPEVVFGGSTTHVVKTYRQSAFWKQWTQETYVILELDEALGKSAGKLLLPTPDELDQSAGRTPVQMVGFDGDVSTSPKPELKFVKCTVSFPATFNGPQYMLHHNCDTSAAGSPGSVLLVRYSDLETYIIGIHNNLIGEDAPAVETDEIVAEASYPDTVVNRGVLAPFIQQHLQAIIKDSSMESAQAGFSSSAIDSSVGSKNETSSPNTADPATSTSSQPPSSNTGGKESSVADTASRINPQAAYLCLGFVGLAWACILFIVLRHLRKPK